MKIVTVVGARPQFIKAAILSQSLRRVDGINEVLVHTGQHFDYNMSDIFFDELGMERPAYHLGIGGGLHGQNTGRMIEAIETVLIEEKPDWVLVYGDTDSTLAAALVAAKLLIPLVHVEAGLRSFNRAMPEEINRILTDHCATLLLAPSQQAMDNLAREGFGADQAILVGDVMYDAALHYSLAGRGRLNPFVGAGDYVLCTIHRKENVDHPGRLKDIVAGIAESDRSIILPLHPRTRARFEEFGIAMPSNVQLIDPVGYLDMIALESGAALILTDSGGVQKEAFFHRVPCVTLRDETEWVELVSAGVNRLVGTDPQLITQAISEPFDPSLFDVLLYGGGEAVPRIVDLLLKRTLPC